MPAGAPASANSSASSIGALGSFSDGFRMKALPQATAIAPIQHGIMIGKLNGVMPATTPSGWRIDQLIHVGGDLLGEVALHVMGDAAGELDDLEPAPDLALGVVEGLAVLERR